MFALHLEVTFLEHWIDTRESERRTERQRDGREERGKKGEEERRGEGGEKINVAPREFAHLKQCAP